MEICLYVQGCMHFYNPAIHKWNKQPYLYFCGDIITLTKYFKFMGGSELNVLTPWEHARSA